MSAPNLSKSSIPSAPPPQAPPPPTPPEQEDDGSLFVVEQLKDLYKAKVVPIEKSYQLQSFLLPTNGEIQDVEFESNPIILIMGQYSTGKTSFIRHLLGGKNFPGMHIGPEPTTDKFVALVHGGDDESCKRELENGGNGSGSGEEKKEENVKGHADGEDYEDEENVVIIDADFSKEDDKSIKGRTVQGNSLTVMPGLPFSTLSAFGSNFLEHFQGSLCCGVCAPLLKSVTLVDTPGVLSGEKQRLSRAYDFAEVAKWFADRSDLILLLFDAHKLDISDELKEIIEKIRPHNDDKIRCVLNKADGVGREQFVRVYGSLMWSMGKIFQTPEVKRVYAGSFWDGPRGRDDFARMFRTDERLLLREIQKLPQSGMIAERRVNAIVKRVRMVKVHTCVLGYVRKQLPKIFGTSAVQQRILDELPEIFAEVARDYGLSMGDLPDVNQFRAKLRDFRDWYSLPPLNPATIETLDQLVSVDIPRLMGQLHNQTRGPLAGKRPSPAKMPAPKPVNPKNMEPMDIPHKKLPPTVAPPTKKGKH